MKSVIFLFDKSGIAAAPWAAAGYPCFCYDILHKEEITINNITYVPWDAMQPEALSAIYARHSEVKFVVAFPPCTDLAVSGAKHFTAKRKANPNFQKEAVVMARLAVEVAKYFNCDFVIENPVSMLATMWKPFSYSFHPYEYGGYLPEDDIHPEYPQYITARDAYRKKTCLWTSSYFVMPPKKPVPCSSGWSKQTTMLGGKSERTKYIRSLTPRGFTIAFYEANK